MVEWYACPCQITFGNQSRACKYLTVGHVSLGLVCSEAVAGHRAPDPYDLYTLVAILRKYVSAPLHCAQGASQLQVAKLSSGSLMCCILVCFVLCGACCLLARCSYAACASHVSVWRVVCGRRCVGLLGRSESSVTLGLQLLTAAVTRGGSALALPGAAPLLHILQHDVALHVVWLGTGCVPVSLCTRRLQSINAAQEKTGLE